MPFVSEVLGKTVTDIDGIFVGILEDLVARERRNVIHPVVDAIILTNKGRTWAIPCSSAMSLFAPAVPLKFRKDEIPDYALNEDKDIFLARDVLDKQIIDTDGARVVRVNDLQIMRHQNTLYVTNVDVGMLGLIRRTPLKNITSKVVNGLKLPIKDNFIAWDNVELLAHDQFMRLKVPAESLAELHPADLAEILSDLNKLETSQFLDAMNVEQVADTLEQVETEFGVSLLENMDDERAADVLEEMDPDEAADILAELPEERSQRLVSLMESEEAEEVKMLMRFPDDTAGGIMTTDYATVRPDITAEQAIKVLREEASEIETLIYVYVTDTDENLLGVFSLTELIFAKPKEKVADFMDEKPKRVHALDDQDTVAQIINKYDLLAVPVVDESNKLLGIVTADDALDKIIPTAWKKRIPRFYH